MKNVLMIAYDFPPISGPGIYRTVRYARHLSRFGWHPVILTVDRNVNNIGSIDSSFLEELSGKVTIYRSKSLELYDIYRFLGGRKKQFSRENKVLSVSAQEPGFSRVIKKFGVSLFIPDEKIGWYPGAIRKAKEIFDAHKIDIIYSTSPRNTSHIIARHLSKRFKTPWVADFRDPWPDYFFERPALLKKWDEYLEKCVFADATKITLAWSGILKDITDRHKGFDKSKCTLIDNGFDENDFKGITPKRFEHFTISHAGRLYRNRNPEALFKGLSLLLREEPELRKDIKILFIGIADPILTHLIDKYRLSDVVQHITFLTHRECLSYLLGSDLLFLNTLGNCVPGKLYEYLGVNKPVLALVPHETQVANIINKTQSGVVIAPEETEKIKDAIKKMYEKYKNGVPGLNIENRPALNDYEAKGLTEVLAGIFNELTKD